jgi:23S rRNA C2498 (ribose-2'-O)-methylase RlmM
LSTEGLLGYCRAGFEPELAAEFAERAAAAGFPGYARTDRGSGFVRFLGVEDPAALAQGRAQGIAEREDPRLPRLHVLLLDGDHCLLASADPGAGEGPALVDADLRAPETAPAGGGRRHGSEGPHRADHGRTRRPWSPR